MAFVLRQERSHCSPCCGCDTMTRDEIIKYGVSDSSYLAFIQKYRSIGPAGILFKYPPGVPRSEIRQPETLYEMSFRISTMLAENAARKYYNLDGYGLVFDYHFPQLKQLREIFTQEFGIPTNTADSILPRLFFRHQCSSAIEALNLMMDVDEHTSYRYYSRDFEKYYSLRF